MNMDAKFAVLVSKIKSDVEAGSLPPLADCHHAEAGSIAGFVLANVERREKLKRVSVAYISAQPRHTAFAAMASNEIDYRLRRLRKG